MNAPNSFENIDRLPALSWNRHSDSRLRPTGNLQLRKSKSGTT